jgi:predicted dehydrogenase
MALTAARAGRHLLLEKPVAMDLAAATDLSEAATATGVASIVFFTDRFIEESRAWFDRVRSTAGWRGGWVRSFSSLQEADNPFGGSPWRQEHGALWDVGPHALSTMSAALGPISSLTAVGGDGDLVNLVLQHDSGSTSTVVLSAFAPSAAEGFEAAVWGEPGLLYMPHRPGGSVIEPYASAAESLVSAAKDKQPHPVDLAFGTRVVELITSAQAQVDAGRSP